MAYVYKHMRNDTNEVFYIGIGKQSNRLYSLFGRNNHWKNIVNKVGFTSEIIEDNLTWEHACKREVYWIKKYGRIDLNEGNLVNKTDGGEGAINRLFSQEHRYKIGKAHKGKQWALGRIHSEKTKQKISNSNKGKHDYLKGLTHSKETKQKMSISKIGNKVNVGRIHSEETKQKIKEKRKLQVFSDESKQKMKESRLNYINKNKKLWQQTN